jgi:membrane protein YdbS with pleckstrin-like domain
MTYPVIESRDEARSGAAAKAVAFVTSLILFLVGLALFAVAFQVDEAWRPWTFFGGIALVALSFMLPMTIIPALEGDD